MYPGRSMSTNIHTEIGTCRKKKHGIVCHSKSKLQKKKLPKLSHALNLKASTRSVVLSLQYRMSGYSDTDFTFFFEFSTFSLPDKCSTSLETSS